MRRSLVILLSLCATACGDDAEAEAGDSDASLSQGDSAVQDAGPADNELLALTYNVAGLPEGLSASMPSLFTPMIGPLLNDYGLVLLQESWKTPEVNPLAPLRGYHEILEEASDHDYKSEAALQPFGTDPDRPTALLSDGLNRFSNYEFDEVQREAWATCVDTASDCLAFKGFSVARTTFAEGLEVDVYNLHMEAGRSEADDEARSAGIDQLLDFMQDYSEERAVIVGGDFNLHTEDEPDASLFARLLAQAELDDVCERLDCDRPGSIDKFLFRSSDEVSLEARSWRAETDIFVSEGGEPLSDHDPIAVRFAFSAPDG